MAIEGFKLWWYTPSIPAAVIAVIVFVALTGYHTYQLVRTRLWYCIPFIVGGLFEIIGYAARAAAHNNINDKIPYIIQSLLLLIAPPLFAASIYMILSRIMRGVRAESYSIIRVKWVTTIFVCGDVACFFVQSAGGGVQATAEGNPDNFKNGENIVLGGLILQIVIFLFFVVVAGIFHYRLKQAPTPDSLDRDLPWERLMWILYSVSILITVRNVVRAIEYGMGSSGYLLTHEWILYVFDGLLMAIVLLVCTMWYHTNLRPRPKSIEAYGMEQQTQQFKIRA